MSVWHAWVFCACRLLRVLHVMLLCRAMCVKSSMVGSQHDHPNDDDMACST